MSHHIVRPATHEEWLEFRKSGIGSSEVGTILGINHFDTPYGLWRKKLGLDPAIAENEAMEMGHVFEYGVADLFSRRTGAIINYDTEGDWCAVDDERPFLRVSPDRMYWEAGEEQTPENLHILECKTTSTNVDEDNLPDYWFCQIQYQMGVMGVKSGALGWVSAYGGRFHFGFKKIDFNPGFYSYLVSNLDHFWNVNVLQKIAPEDVNGDDTKLRFPTADKSRQVVADDTLCKAVEQLVRTKAKIKLLETEESELESIIRMGMQDASRLVDGNDKLLVSWPTVAGGTSFDSKRFREENPEMYDRYTVKKADTRRMSVKLTEKDLATREAGAA